MISHDFIGCSSPSEVAELLHNCLDSPAFFVWYRQHAFCVYKQWRLPHRTTDGNSTQQWRRRILVLLLECSHKCCAAGGETGRQPAQQPAVLSSAAATRAASSTSLFVHVQRRCFCDTRPG